MVKLKLIICLVLLKISNTFMLHADEIITGHYCYNYGDNESLVEAREITRTLAIRNAIESYQLFIESTTKVVNFTLTNDIVQIISTGYIKNIIILEHTENGRTIYEKIQCSINPIELRNILEKKLKNRTNDIESLGLDNNKVLKILKTSFDTTKECINVSVKIQISLTTFMDSDIVISLKNPSYRINNRSLKVYISFFDENSIPIDGDSKLILTDLKNIDLIAGEIRMISFCNIPLDMKSYKVWLYKNDN